MVTTCFLSSCLQYKGNDMKWKQERIKIDKKNKFLNIGLTEPGTYYQVNIWNHFLSQVCVQYPFPGVLFRCLFSQTQGDGHNDLQGTMVWALESDWSRFQLQLCCNLIMWYQHISELLWAFLKICKMEVAISNIQA